MALSYFSNWETLQLPSNTEMCMPCYQEQQQGQEFFVPDENFPCFDYVDSYCVDPFIPFVQSQQSLVPADVFTSLVCPPDLEANCFEDTDQPLPCVKRQKLDHGYAIPEPNFFGGDCPALPLDVLLPFSAPALPEFQVPAAFEFRNSDVYGDLSHRKPDNRLENSKTASAQSIAARERRRRITEKTQELAKLIPSGQKMNTAEMFHAAAKYVKFLQAQIGILQLIASGTREPCHRGDHLQTLLTSQVIQEKLASEEKCLVPETFLERLANDPEIQEKPSVSQEIKELLKK